jgi:hypothetical protein
LASRVSFLMSCSALSVADFIAFAARQLGRRGLQQVEVDPVP